MLEATTQRITTISTGDDEYNADDTSKECKDVEEMNQIHIVF
jgi:hypothetical protein